MSLSAVTDEEIRDALRALKARLAENLGDDLVKLALFGSRARGDFHEDSDVDVVVVVRNLDSRRKDELLDLVTDIKVEYLVPLSPFGASEADFETLKAHERRIALDIEREGVAL